MARIPLQTFVEPREAGVPLPPGAFQQSARASSELMKSIAGAGKLVVDQFTKAQELHNESEISEKRRGIRDAQGIFQNEMLKGPDGRPVDPAEWGPRWQERLKSEKEKLGLDDPKVPPVVKRALSEDFENFAGSSFIQISGAALKENRRRAKSNFGRDLEYYHEVEDYDGGQKLIDAATGTIVTSEEAEDLSRGNTEAQKETNRNFIFENNPIQFSEMVVAGDHVDFRDLSPTRKQKLLRAAESEIDKREIDGLRTIDLMDEAGRFATVEDLKAELNMNPYISIDSAKARAKNYTLTKRLSLPERTALTGRIVKNMTRYLTEDDYTHDDYSKGWDKISIDVEALGNRSGAGGFRSDLHNVRPSLYTGEKMSEMEMKAKAKNSLPIKVTAQRLAAERAGGMAAIAYQEQKNHAEAFTDEKKKTLARGNAKLKNKIDEHAILFRGALERGLTDFIMSHPLGEAPVEPDLREWMDKNYDRVQTEVLNSVEMKRLDVIDEGVKLKTRAEKANALLDAGDFPVRPEDLNPANPLLPKLPKKGEE